MQVWQPHMLNFRIFYCVLSLSVTKHLRMGKGELISHIVVFQVIYKLKIEIFFPANEKIKTLIPNEQNVMKK